jgi:co-chaperonin GroES (HSP10)
VTENHKCLLVPIGGHILILEDEFVYGGRIVIPDKVKRPPTTGRIVAIGPLVDPEAVKLGKRVVYGIYAGTPIKMKNQPLYRSVLVDELLAYVPENSELEAVGQV